MRRVTAVVSIAIGILAIGAPAAAPARAESLGEKANSIRQAMDSRDFDRAESLVRELKSSDPAAFRVNN
jgi:hypothetical protein